MGYMSNSEDMFIRGASASGFIFGVANTTPPFQPTIVVPGNPLMGVPNPGLVNTLLRKKYSGYFADDLGFFTGKTPIQTTNTGVGINNTGEDFYTMVWTGYIYAPSFGDYVFETTSDDASYAWIGDKAISGYTIENADVKNGGLHGQVPVGTLPNVLRMDAGWYPIRLIFGENEGGDYMSIRLYKYGSNVDEYISIGYNTALPNGEGF